MLLPKIHWCSCGAGWPQNILRAMEILTGSPPFYIKRYILRCITLLGQHHNMASLPREPLPILKSYSHGQYHHIKKLQQSKIECFSKTMTTLATEDINICFEAVQQYQTLSTQLPNPTLQPTLSDLKHFVNSTLEAQQSTLAKKKFEAINNGTLLFRPRSVTLNQGTSLQSMGTCFLWGEEVNGERTFPPKLKKRLEGKKPRCAWEETKERMRESQGTRKKEAGNVNERPTTGNGNDRKRQRPRTPGTATRNENDRERTGTILGTTTTIGNVMRPLGTRSGSWEREKTRGTQAAKGARERPVQIRLAPRIKEAQMPLL